MRRRLGLLTGHETWGRVPVELPEASRRLDSLVLAECVRLSRLAGAAQCRLHALDRATALLAQLCEARWRLEASQRTWQSAGSPGEGPGAWRLLDALRVAADHRLRVVEELDQLRPLVGLERFDVWTPALEAGELCPADGAHEDSRRTAPAAGT